MHLGGLTYDPTDPVGRLPPNVLGMVAEFEADPIRARPHGGMAIAKAKGRLREKQPNLTPTQERHLVELQGRAITRSWRSQTSSALDARPLYRTHARTLDRAATHVS